MSPARPVVALSLAAVVALAACSSEGGERKEEGKDGESSVGLSISSDSGVTVDAKVASSGAAGGEAKPSFTEASDGSVSMRSTDGAVVMALRHDSVVVAFSDSLRNAVKAEMAREMKKDSLESNDGAVAELIKGVVQKSVTAGLGEIFDKARGFPVSSVKDVRYEDGAIDFEYVKEPTWTFKDMRIDKKPILESFHPADAARFVGAVRAHLAKS